MCVAREPNLNLRIKRAALFQAPRIAEVRGLPPEEVRALIHHEAQPKTLGVWGQERVSVLELNLALGRMART